MAYFGSTIAKPAHHQRVARKSVNISAMIISPDRAPQPLIVHNISPNGLGLTTRGAPPEQGEELTIRFANRISVLARVAWVDGGNFGVRLDEPLDISQLEHAVQPRRNQPASAAKPGGNRFLAQKTIAPATYRACYL